MLRRRTRLGRGQPRSVVWTREKMLALLAAAVAVTGLLVLGLVLAVMNALRPPQPDAPAGSSAGGVASESVLAAGQPEDLPSGASVEQQRDALAARPMMEVPDSAARPAPVSLVDPGAPLLLPRSTGLGPAAVPTGFPRTPEGALAQLAAIDSVALESGSLVGAREVIAGWAAPGGPTPTSWSGVKAMAGLLTAAKVSSGGSLSLAVTATPLMGLVKGTVGPDFAVVCVDLEIVVTMTSTARGAVADCQRMLWTDGRWLIGPGAEPAEAPSIWPGTDLALAAGYRDLRRG